MLYVITSYAKYTFDIGRTLFTLLLPGVRYRVVRGILTQPQVIYLDVGVGRAAGLERVRCLVAVLCCAVQVHYGGIVGLGGGNRFLFDGVVFRSDLSVRGNRGAIYSVSI